MRILPGYEQFKTKKELENYLFSSSGPRDEVAMTQLEIQKYNNGILEMEKLTDELLRVLLEVKADKNSK